MAHFPMYLDRLARTERVGTDMTALRSALIAYLSFQMGGAFLVCSVCSRTIVFHTVHTARQIPTGTSNSRCLCQRVRFGG